MTMTRRQTTSGLAALLLTLAAVLIGASGASANLQLSRADVSLTNANGDAQLQAGAHPDFNLDVALPQVSLTSDGYSFDGPPEKLRDLDVDLPVGFTGNPAAFQTCSLAELQNGATGGSDCPVAAQVGFAEIVLAQRPSPQHAYVGVYNLATDPGAPAQFGFNYLSSLAIITARVRPDDYGISSGSFKITQAAAIQSIHLELWGVPADPTHDTKRQGAHLGSVDGSPVPSPVPPAAFLSNPTSCPGAPLAFRLRADSWANPGQYDTRTITTDSGGLPFTISGCSSVAFAPTASVQPLSHTADAPTGLDVNVSVPQGDDPYGLVTSHVKDVAVTLPAGMSVSPSSAAGLGACSPAQIGLGSNDVPTCPQSSKIGTVEIKTPLLTEPLDGDVILAKQNDNPFHSLLALYLAVRGPGFYLKLPGRVDLDPVTGQLVSTFSSTPQLPFSNLRVEFQGGSQAPLATPAACGTYTTHVVLTPWSGGAPVALNTPMTIDQGCDAPAFRPSFAAGTDNPLAGQDSSFSLTLTRSDRMPALSQINASLPAGLLAHIGSVPQCPAAQAAAGTCSDASAIGTTSVLSGPGAQPLALRGRVYLTGPYKDAPFGLSIAVPTAGQAGPFDLGVVVVRAGIYVDRTDAHVTVKSDPLPTIIQGIPLRLRQVNVTIDRSGFMINPTSCTPSTVAGAFGALSGATSNQVVNFRIGGCGDLDMGQRLAFRFTGRSSTKDGTHPGITAKLTDAAGGANLKTAEVKLPLSVALDPDNANGLCEPAQRAAFNCPKSSIVGTAKAISVLPHPLTGPVYFVRGVRTSPTGRIIRTLPKLWIPLSGDGVTIDVNANSEVDSINRLVTTFDNIPDAPISEFDLKINGGKHGIITVSGKPGTCERDRTVASRFTGQNGDVKASTTKASVDGCKPTVSKTKASSKSVTVSLANLGSGRLTLAGSLLKRVSRTLKAANAASITAPLTSAARASLRRHHTLKINVSVRFQPKSGKATMLKKSITLRRR
jgi:hypothetical protein